MLRRPFYLALFKLLTGLVLLCGMSLTSFAHQPSESFLRYVADYTANDAADEVNESDFKAPAWRWDIAVLDLHIALNLDLNRDQQISWGEIMQQQSAISQLVQEQLQIKADGNACDFSVQNIQLKDRSDGPYAALMLKGKTPCIAQSSLEIRSDFLSSINPNHFLIINYLSDIDSSINSFSKAIPTGDTRQIALAEQNFFSTLIEYFERGMRHIWEGYDHLLFLLALLLPAVMFTHKNSSSSATSFRPALFELVLIVTAFTIAHSITLALAAYQVIVLPGQPVEILIAASIAIVAALNLFLLRHHHRWPIAFLFGLLHGFGFAGNLLNNELTGTLLISNLVGFNLGVEFGQIVLVILAVPVLWLVYKWAPTFYRWAVLRLGSLFIIAVALYWVIDRL